jgi:hypothetical protein
MENRDWKYWQKRMDEWKATDTKPTEEELAELLQCESPTTSPEQKALIRQHGTKKQKAMLGEEEYLRIQREILKRTFQEEREQKKKKK